MLPKKQHKIRLDTFNLLKGLLIITMVVGHKMPHYDVDANASMRSIQLIFGLMGYACNPAFFIVAGFGFRMMDAKKCASKTAGELLKPYFYVMAAYAICFPLFHYAAFRWWPSAIHETIRFLLAFVLGLPQSGKVFLGYELYECSVVWFLMALFITLNILNAILNLKDERTQRILVLGCFAAGYILAKTEFNYYCLPQSLLGVGYSYAGFLMKKNKLYQHEKLQVICAALAVVAVAQLIWGKFNMVSGEFKYGFIECLAAGCAGALLMFASIIVSGGEWRALDPIKTIGVHAYWIICIHSVDMSCIPWYLWSSYMKENQLLGFIVEMGISCLIYVIGCALLKKIAKYRYKKRRLANG